ncbi:MAG: cupin domain-containing protein [Alphaproteobacteria bacterium]|nr:cupin domain-containing protein [Alphaproteobacteria bacterium]
MTEADHIIALLGLVPHPEGGHYRQMFRDERGPADRAYSTAIYFLLRDGEFSRLHRVDAAEIWHYYRGAPLELTTGREGGGAVRRILGADLDHGERPQLVVPPGMWQSARTLGAYTLVGCTVAPGFEFSRFEIAPADFRL